MNHSEQIEISIKSTLEFRDTMKSLMLFDKVNGPPIKERGVWLVWGFEVITLSSQWKIIWLSNGNYSNLETIIAPKLPIRICRNENEINLRNPLMVIWCPMGNP